MAFLQQFLKPNRWKVGMLVIFTIFYLVFGFYLQNWQSEINQMPTFDGVEKNAPIFIIVFGLIYLSLISIPALMGTSYFLTILFIEFYLLSCLVYFIFTKIKSAFTKHNG